VKSPSSRSVECDARRERALARAGEAAHRVAVVLQAAGERSADEAGHAGDERLHAPRG
jgi:hypothetical protein